MADSRSIQYAGTDILPLPAGDLDLGPDVEALRRVACGESLGRGPRRYGSPAVAVFTDDNGNEFAMLPTAAGPTGASWVSGSRLDAEADRPSAGGFLTSAAVEGYGGPGSPPAASGHNHKHALAAMFRAMTEMGLMRLPAKAPQPAAADGTAGDPGTAAGESAGNPGAGPATAQAEAEEDGKKSVGDAVKEALPGILQEQAVAFLANSWVDGAFNFSNLGDSVLGTLGGVGMAAVGAVAMNLLGGKAPDASSSTAEWAKALLGPALVQRALSMGSIARYLGMGPDKPHPLRVGDIDDLRNAVAAGLPTVLIQNAPAARVEDPVLAPGTKLTHGARTVLIGGKFAARMQDTVSDVAPFTTPTPAIAFKTQIGGPTSNPNPPIPQELKDWARERGLECDENNPIIRDENAPPPDRPGYSLDPATGEWRIWDGKGWSSTVAEFENQFSFRELLDLISPGTQAPSSGGSENWTFLWGLFDLGSPKFPGAGTGSTWFVPDTLFGIDMSSLYTLHDWIFDPGNPAHASLAGLLHVLGDEVTAFANLASRPLIQSLNPFHWVLQAIYSTATTTAGLAQWFDSWMQQLDEDLGLPDRYGQHPHVRAQLLAGHSRTP